MKLFNLLILFTFLMGNSSMANLPDHEKEKPEIKEAPHIAISACIYATGKIGRESKGCSGFGLSCVKIESSIEIALTEAELPKKGKARMCLTLTTLNDLTINFRSDSRVTDNFFAVERLTDFDSKIATELNKKSVKAKPGNYPITKNADGSYSTVISVITN